ncbi:MAG: sensor histidine kinase/response regulator [Alphaproteobacteria bacterium]|nr:MAG: sensor histidine kinase/response regulator [Caulobacteraceae bacterium]TPW07103.1 MAG: sensor histidine kinase/response regulator [Alphaproteobacteria bacterium]
MAVLEADGALRGANAAFRAAFRQDIGPNRAPWGRVTPPPFANGERVFAAPSPDGRQFEWRERLAPDGARIIAARDVSEHAKAAAETARAKTLLFATLTHELRTPLNGILGMAELLRRGDLDASGREYLAAIRTSGEHLLHLITDILDFSRLESGRVMLEEVAFDPEDTVQAIVELLSPRAREKGLELIARVDPQCPARLVGDEGRLRQILFNLAGNAVKFTGKGGVVIEVLPQPKGLRLTVRDTGPGIPADKQSEIFEAFGQVDASHARLYGGAGLGLAIVRKLVEAMRGRMGLVSRPGEGASFWVELPFAAAANAERENLSHLDRMRVTVMAESDLLADSVMAMIRGLGGQVRRIFAISELGEADVLLIDHDVARGDASSFLNLGPPVVLMAPQEDRHAVDAYRAAGLGHHLLKPLRRRSLAARLLAAGRNVQPREALRAEDERAAPALNLGLSVLLADDNPVNALLARTLLQRSGCRVDVVRDGEEAVSAARLGGYDLILLDLRMPRLDGIAAARQIRALPGKAGEVAIIALTADAGEEERVAALKAGMDDFVTKPIDPERLAAVAARFTGGTKTATFCAD